MRGLLVAFFATSLIKSITQELDTHFTWRKFNHTFCLKALRFGRYVRNVVMVVIT